jgi:hypothetical protein
MAELIGQFIVPITIVASVVGSVGIVTLIIVLRDKISGVHVSKTGVQIHTNDVPVWSKIVDEIKRIDSSTFKSLRKATTRLMIFDPEKYGMSAEAMLVIRDANQSLIYAGYENHHTREIASDGGTTYLADKAYDVLESVQVWKKRFPELTDELCEEHVDRWTTNVLIPNVRKACHEKVEYYNSQIKLHTVSKTLKEILVECRDKNLDYIRFLENLAVRLGSTGQSVILFRGETNENNSHPYDHY